MKRFITLYSFFCIMLAQTNVATTAASFLEIGAGAKSLSMGGAYVSVANDVSALYWNPSGIVNVEHPSVPVSYTHLTLPTKA